MVSAAIYTISPEQAPWITMEIRHVASQFFLVSLRDHFVCPVPSFSEMKEIG